MKRSKTPSKPFSLLKVRLRSICDFYVTSLASLRPLWILYRVLKLPSQSLKLLF